jgi:hypothetical protein
VVSLRANTWPNADQDAAFEAPEVKAIAQEVVDRPDPALLVLVRTALTWRLPPHNEKLAKGLAGQAALRDASLLVAAQRVAIQAIKISGRPWDEKVRLQGAVVERIVLGLAKTRASEGVLHECEIRLRPRNRMDRTWSRSKDVVVDANPFEVYECKLGATFDQADLNELADIRDTATDEGRASQVAVACLVGQVAVLARSRVLNVLGDIRYASLENFAEIATEAPRRRL